MTDSSPLRILVCPDSLKGVLTASQAAAELGAGVRAVDDTVEVRELPLSDGGDGLVDVLAANRAGQRRVATVSDARGRPVSAAYLVLDDGVAVVESAEAIGIARLLPKELDPHRASSRGLGELIAAVCDEPDVSSLLLGIGGVATVDGGWGLREVLDELPLPVRVACDVTNPLFGPRGAVRVFGPQKGARSADFAALDERLRRCGFSDEIAGTPGAGAAGGLGAALLSLGASLERGIDLVLEMTAWHDAAAHSDLVVTGEGRVDVSSTEGKVVSGVCTAAARIERAVAVFGGNVDADAGTRLRRDGVAVLSLSGVPRHARADLHALGRALVELAAAQRVRPDPTAGRS